MLWQLCFLVTMLSLRYDAIKRKNMIHLVKFLCPCILQIVTSRLWFHPDTTRHIFHRSSLSKNILPSAKSPRSPESRTGSQLRRWVARIIFGINILAMWWRGTRHTGDETLEEAELRGTFCQIYKLFVQSLGSEYYKHVDEKPSLTPRLHDRVRQVFSLPRILATRLL